MKIIPEKRRITTHELNMHTLSQLEKCLQPEMTAMPLSNNYTGLTKCYLTPSSNDVICRKSFDKPLVFVMKCKNNVMAIYSQALN